MAIFPASWWPVDRPLLLAHRGASHAAPQNTLAAFRLAADLGADGVELDVHLSADGVPVVIHDARLSTTTDGSGLVYTKTLAQLKELDAGASFGPEFAGERIPTLQEVFAEVGHRLIINVELKSSRHEPELEPAVAGLARWMGMLDRIWFSSFRPYALYSIRQLVPETPCGLLYLRGSVGTQLLASFTPHEALHPEAHMVTAGLIARAHRRGLRVSTWTVDDPQQAQRLASWGIDALITNEPARILEAL